MKITGYKAFISVVVTIFITLLATFTYGSIPVYWIGLPEDIQQSEDIFIPQISLYGMLLPPETSAAHIRYVLDKVETMNNVTFRDVVNRFQIKAPFKNEDIELIGYKEDTIYVIVTWGEFASEPYGYWQTDLALWQAMWYNCLTLTLTSIPGIDNVQYVVKSDQPTGMVWRDLNEPMNRHTLFNIEWLEVGVIASAGY